MCQPCTNHACEFANPAKEVHEQSKITNGESACTQLLTNQQQDDTRTKLRCIKEHSINSFAEHTIPYCSVTAHLAERAKTICHPSFNPCDLDGLHTCEHLGDGPAHIRGRFAVPAAVGFQAARSHCREHNDCHKGNPNSQCKEHINLHHEHEANRNG